MITNEQFLGKVKEEIIYLNKALTPEQKMRLDADKLHPTKRCIYQQVFGSYIADEALLLKRNFLPRKDEFFAMSYLERYLCNGFNLLSNQEWRVLSEIVVANIGLGYLLSIPEFEMDTDYLKKCLL